MKFGIRASIFLLSCAVASPSSAEDFGNDSIIALTRAGIGGSVLLAKIASLPCSYDVSTKSLVQLKGAGVSDAVIAAMVDRCTGSTKAQGAFAASSDPSAKRSPGLYIDFGNAEAHRLEKIRPIHASGARMTGNGSILFPFKAKLAVPRAAARTVAGSAKPNFYFYFETDDAKVGDFGTLSTHAVQSPSEFTLVRFKQKDGQREMVIGKLNPFGAKEGIDPKESMQFSFEEIGDGIFSATTLNALAAGDYGFVLQGEKGAYRIYDFQVR